ncbi:helix-turn-helix domain-containing protein [Qaidamihabitans albus]|uniref:helix-turn-helix domain-containing protein n=1 Tax=Qaidamihabitans albus TaxID=2795733 RepID=UPI0018F24D26|nr:helix-turn-helix domain-containing protein [Qaidamihabitans albus]
MDSAAELAEVAEELRRLGERVDALERRDAHKAPAHSPEEHGRLWALDGLKRRLAEHEGPDGGAVLLAGTVTLPTGEPADWQEGAGSAALLEGDWSELAPTLAALSHPVRLELLRQVLNGVRTTAALADVESLGSTGQLHHHLRQLVTAGWLRQGSRGSYEMPVTRIVPLLVILTAVRR